MITRNCFFSSVLVVIKKITIVLFILFLIIPLFQKEAYCAPFNTPKDAINAYFDVCIKYLDNPTSSNLEKILDVDGVYYRRILNKVKQTPDAYKKDEEIKAREEEKKYFLALREEVTNRLFVFNSPTMRMAMGGGHQLFAIIHPGMKYKIVEIRDDQALMEGNRKVAFVEVIYSDPAHSPGYQHYEGIVQKAVIKIVFSTWNLKSKKQAYLVDHYEPTKYKLELWGK